MQRRQMLAWGSAALVASPHLFAQGKYPQRPITLVVPTAPGGSTDFTARLISDSLARALGQPVIVDNRPGASGNIGNQIVARARPDGYTLLVSYSGYHVGNPHLFRQAGWDPLKDFAPEVKRKAEDSGTAVETMTPRQLGDFTRSELDYWGKVIRSAKITAE